MTNFHKSPFDEGTITKLALFSAYAKEWLPVFVSPKYAGSTVTIVDFFAGPGRDVEGKEGTPLLLLRTIREYTEHIKRYRIHVRLLLNEGVKWKAKILKTAMEEQNVADELCEWDVSDLSFDDVFTSLYPQLSIGPNLLLLDQQGMKFISDDVFQKLLALNKTDFVFFIASSFIRRFWDHPHFKRHLPIPTENILGQEFSDIHRIITDYYRSLIPSDKQFYLAPFSIRKGSNIYGLIFGSAHTLGILKFLRVCWAIDPERGEANFDIDGDEIDSSKPYLFEEMNTPSKISRFEAHLEEHLLSGKISTDGGVYEECLKEGVLPKHGREVLRPMIKEGRIRVQGGLQPRISEVGRQEPRGIVVTGDVNIKD